jgi:hypothetical protein
MSSSNQNTPSLSQIYFRLGHASEAAKENAMYSHFKRKTFIASLFPSTVDKRKG